MIEDICERFEVCPAAPEPQSIVGIAVQTLTQRPVTGLRHPPEGDTNGWYIWCGEFSEADDFFEPLHVEHLKEYLPQVRRYLSLPPGFRFLFDNNGYEDIWFDDSLLDV